MNISQIKFEWINSWEEIWSQSFLVQWQKLLNQDIHAHVFFTPSVVRAWVETQQTFRTIQPRIMVVRQAGDLLFLFPLVLERENWQGGFVRSLQPVGWNSFDYHTPLMAPSLVDQKGDQLLEFILASCRIRFAGEYDILKIPFLFNNSFPQVATFLQVDEAPFLDIKGLESLDQITANLSKGWNHDIRRQRRRLAQAGAVELVICEPNEVERARVLLPHLMAFHSERWGYQRNESAKHRIMTLWDNLALYALPDKKLHIAALRCGDEVIACSLSFQFNKRFYFYIPASAAKWANYSPGKLLLSMLLEHAVINQFELFDFLRGNESYKKHWTDKTVPLYCVEEKMKGFGPHLRNGVQESLVKMRSKVKKIIIGGRAFIKNSS